MKFVFPGALLACAIAGNAAAAGTVAQMPAPAAQKEASLWAARVIERYRYKPKGLPDGGARRPFDRFIEALDPEHMVFTQASLEDMAGQRAQIEKLTDEKQMEIPNAIFANYLARAIALHTYAQEVLGQPLKFNGNERFQRVRSKAGWEADEDTLRDLWRRRLMDEYLNLRLAGTAEAQIAPTLQRRYENRLQRLAAMKSEDVASLFLNAYVAAYDPHAAYLQPVKPFDRALAEKMVGIGLVMQKKEDLITVLEVAPGSSSDRSGEISPGDRIVGVAQAGQAMTEVIGWRIDDVVAQMRGVPGSQVTLAVLPLGVPRDSAPRRVVLTREKIQLAEQRATGRVELVQHGATSYRIGVITVPTFYQDFEARRNGAKDYASVTRDVAAALAQMRAQDADAVLLDMRNNGGGSLIEAVDLTGLFLPGAQVVQQVSHEHKVAIEKAPEGAPAWDGPLAILIGRRSSAATEIAAAAIQDYGRGLIIGDVSYGRGSVQTIVNLNRFSADPAKELGDLKLTVAVLCRAGGKPMQPAGVTPDILVPGRIDVTGQANADLFPGAACKTQDISKNTKLESMMPTLTRLHERRMQANQGYHAQLARQAKEEALLSSDEVSLNEAERHRTQPPQPAAGIAKLQMAEALQVLSDAVDQMRQH
ncbi:S41 family peptidase [Pseudoduganella sp. R-43]|uniref:S41 family peptidase n=1 Tax=Pseudoduganella sp. R-43 TaxID=3404063 RepID=UPI003CFA9951